MMKKLIVVTGGTKGIGKAVVERFINQGFDVVTCARNESDLEQLDKQLQTLNRQGKLFYKRADLSEKDQVFQFAEFVNQLMAPIEILVNNTGVFLPGQIHNEEEGTFETMINTNLSSAYHLTRKLLPDMMQRKKGYIFNICSTASITPYTNGGSYCISKFAMLGMSKVLREELKPFNIRVTSVLPGATLTASWSGTDLPEERFMKPEDVADAIFGAYSLSNHSVVEEILIRPQLGDI